jgi:hypothetical protein
MTPSGQDEEHLRLLSIFHYVLGGMLAVFSCIPIIHVVLGVLMLTSPSFFGGGHGHQPPAGIGVMFVVFGGGFVLFGWSVAGMMLYAGRCLSRRARHLYCLVVAAVSCLFVPIGTALGVFTIIVLNRPSVKLLFAPSGPPRFA